MCTLTYLPVDGGYIFTHNRDERNDRPTSKDFSSKETSGQKIYYPEDLEAHGSWIAFSDSGISMCLLNGGTELHKRKPSYRQSRGLVVLDSFNYDGAEDFHRSYNFEGIEPFTLLMRYPDAFYKLVHDEGETRLEQQDISKPNIWSSTTLYTREVRDKRNHWFQSWLHEDPVISPGELERFHQSAGDGDSENDLIMSRWGILQTLSLTQIALVEQEANILYRDFIQESSDRKTLNIRP